jgi:hypothetical protein
MKNIWLRLLTDLIHNLATIYFVQSLRRTKACFQQKGIIGNYAIEEEFKEYDIFSINSLF